MPKSIVMYPDAAPLFGGDLLYLVKAAGGADRDRKLDLETLRQFCTTQGVRLMEATLALASAPAITEVDVTGTSNVVLVVWGRFPSPTDNRVNVHGTIPEGCTVTVISGHLGILDLRVNGSTPTDSPADLDFGTLGQAVLTSRDDQFLVSVFNDSRWVKSTRDTAIAAETERAQAVEGDLLASVQAEAETRAEGDSSLATQLSSLATTIDQRLDPVEAASAEYELLSIVAADVSLLRWSAGTVDSSSYFKIRRRQGILDLELNMRVNAAANGGALMAEIIIAPPSPGSLFVDLLTRIAEKGFIPDSEVGSVFSQPGLIVPGVAVGSRGSIVAPATSYMAYICERDGYPGQLSILFFGQNMITNGTNGLSWEAVMQYNSRMLLQHVIL